MDNTKVFVIEADSIEGYYIYGIYSTIEKAEEVRCQCERRNKLDVMMFGYDNIYYRVKEYLVH